MSTRLREISSPFSADPDYEALQQVPADLIDLTHEPNNTLGFTVVAYNGGTPVSGTFDLQPIEVSGTNDAVTPQIVSGGYIHTNLVTGRRVDIVVSRGRRVGIRILNPSFGAATKVKVFWRRLQ